MKQNKSGLVKVILVIVSIFVSLFVVDLVSKKKNKDQVSYGMLSVDVLKALAELGREQLDNVKHKE